MESDYRKEKIKLRVASSRECEEREHFHQDIELLYVLEGSMDVVTGEQKTQMEAEDILVINANKKHSMYPSKDILLARLMVPYELVSDIFKSMDIIFWCDSTKGENEHYEELRKALNMLLNHYLNMRDGTVYFGYISLCYRILDILSVHFLVKSSDKMNWGKQDQFSERLFQINNYMRMHYNQPISLKDLSEKLFLSNSYLSRFFKKNYGMSFSEYLANIRLYHAVDELLNSSAPITKIAFDNGFASVTVFNKAFKKAFGETPSSYRNKSKGLNLAEGQTERSKAVEERLEHFLVNGGVTVEENDDAELLEVTYSVLDTKPLKPVWNQMINIGAAEELLRSEVREHVLLLHEALGFKYIRFWNIFSKQLLIDITCETGEYNFSRLDSIIDFLVQNGMKPHIELGQKPKRILGNIQNILVKQMPTSEFKSEAQWNRVMHAMLQHLIHRYGRQEFDSWKIEIWFDEGKRDQDDAIMDYLRHFQNTAGVIRSHSKNIKLGGCGIRADFKEALNTAFIRKWSEMQYQPDYLSIIYYAYIRGADGPDADYYSKRDTDNDALYHWVMHTKQMMKEGGMEHIPVYITEWNLTISDRNYINDTCFKGAYMMKNALDVYEEVEELDYFTATDRVSEHYDSNALLHGGMGIISKDGIFKPAAFAIDLLNRLYKNCIGKGHHHLVTSDGHDTYGIVCHNQKKLNYNYYFTKEDELDKESMWKYYEDRNALEIQISLADIKDGTYQIRTYHTNEQNGNILGLWGEMNYDKALSREEIKYFRRICEPKLIMQKIKVAGGVCQLNIKLEANEMLYIDLYKVG